MCAFILSKAELEPGYFIGGIPKNLPSGAAIGGQRIEEFMINSTILSCADVGTGVWNAQLLGQQVVPFQDMSVRGFIWYQGAADA
jgi:hypothetical protein